MNKKGIIQTAIGILIIIIIFFTYLAGYRLTRTFAIGKVGTIEMTIPLIQTSVLVDGHEKIKTSKDNEKVTIRIAPGSHKIIVTRPAYFPWVKNIVMPSGGLENLVPMFVSQNTSGVIIYKNDPEYWKIKNLVASDVLPTKEHRTTSEDGTTTIWVENNAILSETLGKIHTVIQSVSPIKNLAFYKNRSDVVVFSTMNSISAIEVSTDSFQNFMPIYKGTDPYFIATDPGFLYVVDGNTLLQVVI